MNIIDAVQVAHGRYSDFRALTDLLEWLDQHDEMQIIVRREFGGFDVTMTDDAGDIHGHGYAADLTTALVACWRNWQLDS